MQRAIDVTFYMGNTQRSHMTSAARREKSNCHIPGHARVDHCEGLPNNAVESSIDYRWIQDRHDRRARASRACFVARVEHDRGADPAGACLLPAALALPPSSRETGAVAFSAIGGGGLRLDRVRAQAVVFARSSLDRQSPFRYSRSMLPCFRSTEIARQVFDEYSFLDPRLRALWNLCSRATSPAPANDDNVDIGALDLFDVDAFSSCEDSWCAEDFFFEHVKPMLVQLVGWSRMDDPPELRSQNAYDAVYSALFFHALHRGCACCRVVSDRHSA
jgi:hypothetical protein